VILSCGVVIALLLRLLFILKQNDAFSELCFDFIQRIADNQHARSEWTPLLRTIFSFIFLSNWMRALIPWKFVHLPSGSIAAPTNDINTTVRLALIVSVSYFFARLRKNGTSYWARYFEPYPFLFPLKLLEDFTKPLSLSFRLFGNILADELVVAVLVSLVPLVLPIPLILLRLFTSAIQALIFTTLAANYIGEAKE